MRRFLVLALLSVATPALAGEPQPQTVALEGVKAEVRAPKGEWPRTTEAPAAGQWRVVLRGKKAQLEARVFPVKVEVTEDVKAILWQAADKTSRQMQGGGFGLPGVRVFQIDGHPAAESDYWVQSGTSKLEGRIRILRASPQSWALAWGLAAPEAERAERDAAVDFAGTLVPSEPAFFEPALGDGDPEEVFVALAGEPPVLRRHLLAVLALAEAGAGARLSRAGRAGLLDALAREAREEGPRHREALRTAAESYAETGGLSAEKLTAAREALGKRILDAAKPRSDAGKVPAQLLLGTFAQGRQPVAGTAEDGLTRLQAETWLDACALIASVAADAPVLATREQRETERAGLATRWGSLSPDEHAATRTVAKAGADVAVSWAEADAAERFAFRVAVAAALLPRPPAPPASPGPASAATPQDLKALRAWLDASPRDPEALFHAACELAPSEQARLLALLSTSPSR